MFPQGPQAAFEVSVSFAAGLGLLAQKRMLLTGGGRPVCHEAPSSVTAFPLPNQLHSMLAQPGQCPGRLEALALAGRQRALV